MLQLLSQIHPADHAALGKALTEHLHAVAAPAARGDRSLVGRAEREVREDPGAHLRFAKDGLATLTLPKLSFASRTDPSHHTRGECARCVKKSAIDAAGGRAALPAPAGALKESSARPRGDPTPMASASAPSTW